MLRFLWSKLNNFPDDELMKAHEGSHACGTYSMARVKAQSADECFVQLESHSFTVTGGGQLSGTYVCAYEGTGACILKGKLLSTLKEFYQYIRDMPEAGLCVAYKNPSIFHDGDCMLGVLSHGTTVLGNVGRGKVFFGQRTEKGVVEAFDPFKDAHSLPDVVAFGETKAASDMDLLCVPTLAVTLLPKHEFIVFTNGGVRDLLPIDKAVQLVADSAVKGCAKRVVQAAQLEAARIANVPYSTVVSSKAGERAMYHDDLFVLVIFLDHVPKSTQTTVLHRMLHGAGTKEKQD